MNCLAPYFVTAVDQPTADADDAFVCSLAFTSLSLSRTSPVKHFFSRSSPLVEEFTSRFPGMSFHNVLSEFSLPAPLSQHNNPLGLPQQKVQLPEYLFYRWGVAVSTAKSQNLPLHVALNELFVVLL